jgi:hypothetical protein
MGCYIAGVRGFGIHLNYNAVSFSYCNGGDKDGKRCVIIATGCINLWTIHFKQQSFSATSAALINFED